MLSTTRGARRPDAVGETCALSSEAVLPASAVDVPDQVMSEGASSAPDAAVRLGTARVTVLVPSQRQRDSILITPRAMLSCFWMTLMSVERLNSVVKSVVGKDVSCRCERLGLSNESCLLDLLAAARDGNGNLQRKIIGKCVRQHKRGILGAVGHCEEFDPVLVHCAKKEEKDFIHKMGVYDVVPRSDAAEKGCRVIRTRWVTVNRGSDDAPQ